MKFCFSLFYLDKWAGGFIFELLGICNRGLLTFVKNYHGVCRIDVLFITLYNQL